MKQSKKAIKRVRPTYDRKRGTRSDGAVVYRGFPTLAHNPAHPCACGRTISANKTKCAGCVGVR